MIFDPVRFVDTVVSQDEDGLREFFWPTASVCWPNTGEQFTVDEYLRANCDYPGIWTGQVERVEQAGATTIVVARISAGTSFYVTSFILVVDGLIERLDEYWGDVGDAPRWRKDMGIGTSIPAAVPGDGRH